MNLRQILNIILKYDVKVQKFPDSEGTGKRYVMGLCSNISNTIYIREDMCMEDKTETLLHELIHADMFERGIPSELHNEKTVEAKAQRLIKHGILGDNSRRKRTKTGKDKTSSDRGSCKPNEG